MQIMLWVRYKVPMKFPATAQDKLQEKLNDLEIEFKGGLVKPPELVVQMSSIMSMEDVFLPGNSEQYYYFNLKKQELEKVNAVTILRYTAEGLAEAIAVKVVGTTFDLQMQIQDLIRQQNEDMIRMHNAQQLSAGIPAGAVIRR